MRSITTPLKNSANNLEGSLIEILLFSFESFLLIGFNFFITVQAIQVPQKTILLIEDHAIYPMHHLRVIDVKI